MVDIVSIPQNLFYIIILVIAVIGLIMVFIQWRRVKEANNNVQFLEKQAELRKIELVEKELDSKRMMENTFPMSEEKQERLYSIRKNTKDIINQSCYLHSEINERVMHRSIY